MSTYGLTTVNRPKSREVSTNDGIITQKIFLMRLFQSLVKQNKRYKSHNLMNI